MEGFLELNRNVNLKDINKSFIQAGFQIDTIENVLDQEKLFSFYDSELGYYIPINHIGYNLPKSFEFKPKYAKIVDDKITIDWRVPNTKQIQEFYYILNTQIAIATCPFFQNKSLSHL